MKKILLILVLIAFSFISAAQTPENITLSLETDTDKVYIDGEQRGEGTYTDLEFPYIISDQPLGIISLGGFEKLDYSSGSSDTFSITQTTTSFLVPNTDGGFQEIEDEQSSILDGSFLNRIEPSFLYTSGSKALVKVRFQPDIDINSSKELRERGKLSFRNSGGSVSLK